MSEYTNEEVVINIKRIKDVVFSLNDSLFVPGNDKIIKIEIGLTTAVARTMNVITMLVRVFYHYPDSPPDEILLDIQVQNVFEIPELDRYRISPDDIKLPPKTIAALVGASIDHTRALLAQSIAGTVFQENYLPMIDPYGVARSFFPKMFETASDPGELDELLNQA